MRLLTDRPATASAFASGWRATTLSALPRQEQIVWGALGTGPALWSAVAGQQRVFLARALAQSSDLYFMDEPFAGVDVVTEEAILKVLHELKQQGKTVLVVHHDLETVRHYFDHLTLLNVQIIASGPIWQTFTPENLKATYGERLVVHQI